MKTTTLVLVLFSFFGLNAQQLPNAGFENWTSKVIIEPEGFFTTNQMLSGVKSNVTQVTDAYHGFSAVKLETVINGNDTLQGMLLIGMPGDHGIDGGIPFTGTPDSVSFYAKYDIQPNDTAYFIIAFKKGGELISQPITIFTGSQLTFKRFSISTDLVSTNPPDSLIALISSSRMDPPRKAGSTMTIDSITFIHSTEQLPNNDFENWITQNAPEDPAGWGTYAGQYPSYNLPVLVTKTVDAHDGNFAVKIVSDTGYVQPPFGNGEYGDTIVGTLQLNMINGFSSTKYPFAYRPDSLVGFVKGELADYADNMNFIWLQFTNNGSVIGQLVYRMQNNITDYTRFAEPVNYNSELMPDSMICILFAGNPGKYYPGNIFYVDDLTFIYNSTTQLNNAKSFDNFNVYFDALNNSLTVESQKRNNDIVVIYDLTAKAIKIIQLDQPLVSIDLSELQLGIYLYNILNDKSGIQQTGKFAKY